MSTQKRILVQPESSVPGFADGFTQFVVDFHMDTNAFTAAPDVAIRNAVIDLFNAHSSNGGISLDSSTVNTVIYDSEFNEFTPLEKKNILDTSALKVKFKRVGPAAVAPAGQSPGQQQILPRPFLVTCDQHKQEAPITVSVPVGSDLNAFKTAIINVYRQGQGKQYIVAQIAQLFYRDPTFDDYLELVHMKDVVADVKELQIRIKSAASVPPPAAAPAPLQHLPPPPAAGAIPVNPMNPQSLGFGPGAMNLASPGGVHPAQQHLFASPQQQQFATPRGDIASPTGVADRNRDAGRKHDRDEPHTSNQRKRDEADDPYSVVFLLMIMAEELTHESRVKHLGRDSLPHVRKSRIFAIWGEVGAVSNSEREKVWQDAHDQDFIEIERSDSNGKMARLRSAGSDLLDGK